MKIEKFIAQKKFPENIKYAVTIPASFKEQQRTQFLKCLKNAGIVMNNNPFIDEPIAAFISCVYENHEKGFSLDTPKNILVLDLGAGTCDISVLNVGKDENGIYAQNLSIARYGNIGGEKLDAMIAEKVLKEQFLDSIGNESETAYENAYNQICSIAEKVKIKLCKSIDVFPGDGFSLPDKALTEKIAWLPNQKTSEGIFSEPYISYKDFYDVMKEYCAFDSKVYGTIGYSVASALDKANIESDDINYILLTGGGSRNPYFRSFVAEEFLNSEILIPDNIQEHVARGCAIHSLILNAFGSFILSPVLSDEISLICINETMKIFDSNTTAPSKEIIVENIVPVSLNQKYIDLPIVDGNDDQIIKVFSFKVKPKENYKAIFWIDADKTIECEVHSNQDIVLCHSLFPEKEYKVKNQFIIKP